MINSGTCLLERRIGNADITIRFPRDWLGDWQQRRRRHRPPDRAAASETSQSVKTLRRPDRRRGSAIREYRSACAFFDFQEQHADEFLADINFQRIRFLRPRHHANILVVELAPQIGVERRHRLDAGIVADLDDHAEIERAVAVLVVDGQFAEIVLADENLGGIVRSSAPREYARCRTASSDRHRAF